MTFAFLCLYIVVFLTLTKSVSIRGGNNSSFSIVSPHDKQILVTDLLLLFIQTNSSQFTLGSSGVICIDSILIDSIEGTEPISSQCFSSFPEYFPSVNNSFILAMEMQSGNWQIVVTAAKDVDRSLIFHQSSVSFQLVRSDDCAQYSEFSRSNVNEIMLYDSTYYFENEEDILLMRLLEHVEVDVFVPIEANQAHNGTARRLVLHAADDGISSYNTLMNDSIFTEFILKNVKFKENSKVSVRNHLHSNTRRVIARSQLISSDLSTDRLPVDTQQRDAITYVLSSFDSNYDTPSQAHYTINSDTDEIFNRSSIRKLKECKVLSDYRQSNDSLPYMIVGTMDYYLYNFNNFIGEWGLWTTEGPFIIANELINDPNDDIMTPTKIRRLWNQNYRSTLIELLSKSNFAIWKDMGWHVSMFESPADMCKSKAQNTAYENIKDFFFIDNCDMLQQLGIVYEKLLLPENKLVAELVDTPVNMSRLPLLVQSNVELLDRYAKPKAHLSIEEKRNMIRHLQSENRLFRQLESDAAFTVNPSDSLEYYIPCVGIQRFADRDEIQRIICCAECEVARLSNNVDCDSIIEYVDMLCSQSSNQRVRVGLNVK